MTCTNLSKVQFLGEWACNERKKGACVESSWQVQKDSTLQNPVDLLVRSADLLIRWSAGPLVRWSADPLIRWAAAGPDDMAIMSDDSPILVQVHRAGSVNGLTMKTIAKLNFLPRYVHRFIHSCFSAQKKKDSFQNKIKSEALPIWAKKPSWEWVNKCINPSLPAFLPFQKNVQVTQSLPQRMVSIPTCHRGV